MESIWVLMRCYRMVPGGACLVLGAYQSAGSAIAYAEEREHVPIDTWKEPRPGHQLWHAEHRQYEYRLESFTVPVEPLPPPHSIELHTIH